MRSIQVFKPSYDCREVEELRLVLESGWTGLGPRTAAFEGKFAEYVGAKYAVGMNSATAALHLALVGLGIGPGDEVLVPTITFVSTAHAVSYTGATPVFCDVNRDTLCIDVKDAAGRVTEQTKAIIPVHYGGHPCDMAAIWGLAYAEQLKVVEDAAHACGSWYHSRRVGGLDSDATCFSFHAVKNLSTGDGGMVTTRLGWLDQKLRRLRWCGIDKDTWRRVADRPAGYGWHYEVAELGYKCHMNDLAAGLGLVQLEKLEEMNHRRDVISILYDLGLGGVSWIECPVVRDGCAPSHHNYVIKVECRDALNLYLKKRGIATGVHYMPIHLQPYYRSRWAGSLPVAEEVWTKLLTLPLYPDLTDEEVEYVIKNVRSFDDSISSRQ